MKTSRFNPFGPDAAQLLAFRLQGAMRERTIAGWLKFKKAHPNARAPHGYEWLDDAGVPSAAATSADARRRARLAAMNTHAKG